jgi:hypothetical protein
VRKHLPDEAEKNPTYAGFPQTAVHTIRKVFHGIIDENPSRRLQPSFCQDAEPTKTDIILQDSCAFQDSLTAKKF